MKKKVGAGVLAILVPFVMFYEGSRLQSYLDPIKIPTICYGHTTGVVLGQVKTKKECDDLLETELIEYAHIVDKYVMMPMTDNRKAALTSLVYNIGEGNFRSSTLVKKLNKGDVGGGCREILRWNRAGGKVLPGLTKRREAEYKLCLQ